MVRIPRKKHTGMIPSNGIKTIPVTNTPIAAPARSIP